MGRFRRLILVSALLVSVSLSGKDYLEKLHVDIADGLSQPSVTSVAKDGNGVLWIGTQFGLNKFRSGELKNYYDSGTPASLISGNHVYALFSDSRNALWLSTDKGLSLYDSKEDCFRSKRDEIVLCMLELEDRILFGGYEGLFSYDKRTEDFTHETMGDYPTALIGIFRYAPGEILLVGSGGTLLVYSLESGEIRKVDIPGMPGGEIRQGMMYGDKLILSIFGKGIYVVDPYTEAIKYRCNSSNSGLTFDIVLSMALYGNHILLGTDGDGVFALDPKSGNVSTFEDFMDRPEAMLPPSVNCIFVESQESIWIGSVRSGAYNLRKSSVRTLSMSDGIPEDAIIGLYREDDGRIWVASDGGGLSLYNPQTDKVSPFPETYGQKITSVCPLGGGKVLLSVYSKMLSTFDPKTRVQKPFVLVDAPKDYAESQSGYVPVLERVGDDDILIFGSKLYRYRISSAAFSVFEGDEPLAGLRLFGRREDGSLLAYSYDGVFKIDLGKERAERLFRVEDGHFINTAAYCGGLVWLGSDYGLQSLYLENKLVHQVQTELFRRVTCLKATEDGFLWIAADHTLLRYYTHSGRLELMDSGMGLQGKEILCSTQADSFAVPEYFGFNGGMLQIFGGNNPVTSEVPAPEFYEAFIDGRRIHPENRMQVLPEGYKSFSVTVNIPDDNPFSRRRYRFMVDGSATLSTETFSSTYDVGMVLPGKYKLSVSTLMSDGNWSPAVDIISFRLPVPWYYSWWFFLCLAVIALGIVILVVRYLKSKAKVQLDMERMGQREHYAQERIRFLTTVSHEIRTPLTLVYAPLKRLFANLSGTEYEDAVSGVLTNVEKMKDITNIVMDGGQEGEAYRNEFPAWVQAVKDGANTLGGDSDTTPVNLTSCNILCVEDNGDLASLIKSELERYGAVVSVASNGLEGLNMAHEVKPDIIVSDVMMPELDGFELCRRVKSDVEISHIPIVLLTARGDASSVLHGYKAGADSYLAKPFDTELLVQVIQNLLTVREKIRQSFADMSHGNLSQEQLTLGGADETFMEKINELITSHLADADFDVIALASEMAMSRASLYNKLKAMTGMGVAQYADTIRIRTACRQLTSTEMSIAEISDMLGFGAPRSFSTWFKQKTGQSPVAYRKNP